MQRRSVASPHLAAARRGFIFSAAVQQRQVVGVISRHYDSFTADTFNLRGALLFLCDVGVKIHSLQGLNLMCFNSFSQSFLCRVGNFLRAAVAWFVLHVTQKNLHFPISKQPQCFVFPWLQSKGRLLLHDSLTFISVVSSFKCFYVLKVTFFCFS